MSCLGGGAGGGISEAPTLIDRIGAEDGVFGGGGRGRDNRFWDARLSPKTFWPFVDLEYDAVQSFLLERTTGRTGYNQTG